MFMVIWWLLMGGGLGGSSILEGRAYEWVSDPNTRFCHKLKQHTRLHFFAKKAVLYCLGVLKIIYLLVNVYDWRSFLSIVSSSIFQ
jgi:hypothetical protein